MSLIRALPVALALVALAVVPQPTVASPAAAPAPCDAAGSTFLGGFSDFEDVGCNGEVSCDANETTGCAFQLEVTLEGLGTVEAAAFIGGGTSTESCLGALSCTFTVPFAVDPGASRVWACWAAARTNAVDVSLTCEASAASFLDIVEKPLDH